MSSHPRAKTIRSFWFGEENSPDHGRYRRVWFQKDDDFDAQIREQFSADVERAAAGEYDDWKAIPEDAVALILLLDQFPRNLYRGDPKSFATDSKALTIAQSLVNSKIDRELPPAYRFFVYLPYEHSELFSHQKTSVSLMESLVTEVPDLDDGLKGGVDFAKRHRDVIQKFGRFPHRNEILGRSSTPVEIEFLKQPGSGF